MGTSAAPAGAVLGVCGGIIYRPVLPADVGGGGPVYGLSPYRDAQMVPARDTPENRAEYVEEHSYALVLWMRDAYPDILDEFLEYAPRYGAEKYRDWLN